MDLFDKIHEDQKNRYEFWRDKLYYLECELLRVSQWDDTTELLAHTKLGALNYLFGLKKLVLDIEKAIEGEKMHGAALKNFADTHVMKESMNFSR